MHFLICIWFSDPIKAKEESISRTSPVRVDIGKAVFADRRKGTLLLSAGLQEQPAEVHMGKRTILLASIVVLVLIAMLAVRPFMASVDPNNGPSSPHAIDQ
jgi:hypothetical protein